MTTFNKLANRAECINKVHSYLNETAKEIKAELEKGFKLNNDFSLCKRDKARVQEIIDKRPHFRAFLSCSEYSISLKCDDNYADREPDKNNCYTCTYYGRSVYLYDNTNKKAYDINILPMVTTEELEKAEKELEEVNNNIFELKNKKYRLERLLKD